MDHFLYRGGTLHAEDVPIAEIAAQVGTPFYVYSTATLTRHFHLFDEALDGLPHLVCFAMKSLSNQAVLKTLAQAGAGMDVVSGGGICAGQGGGRARQPHRLFGCREDRSRDGTGPDRRHPAVQRRKRSRDGAFVVRSAVRLGKTASITVRVNPDVDARTHAKIATGKSENKFGIPIDRARDVYAHAAALPGIDVIGIDVHIGSQLTELAPFAAAYQKIAALTEALRADGHTIDRLDLGGGLGIPYERSNIAPPLPTEYGAMIKETLGHLGCEIEIEPGRLISGNAGLMVASVVYVKDGADRQFLILDAAMNDLIRPAMYDAWHDIVPVVEPAPGAEPATFDVVGPVCESGDTFAKGRTMAAVARGDLVAFRSAGAYGAVMSSEYNSRPLIPEVLVHGDQFAVIRPRPTFDEMIARDTIPSWLD